MYEFEDDISARLLENFTCSRCNRQFPNYLKSRTQEDICSYCTGERINHCKGCMGEDCACCEHKDFKNRNRVMDSKDDDYLKYDKCFEVLIRSENPIQITEEDIKKLLQSKFNQVIEVEQV